MRWQAMGGSAPTMERWSSVRISAALPKKSSNKKALLSFHASTALLVSSWTISEDMSVAAIGTWRLTRRASILALINYRLSYHRSLKIMHLLARSRRHQSMMERVHRAMLVIQEFLDPYFKRLKRSLAVERRSRLLTLNLMAVPMEHSTSSLR